MPIVSEVRSKKKRAARVVRIEEVEREEELPYEEEEEREFGEQGGGARSGDKIKE